MAKQIYRYLVKNDYTDDADQIAGTYHEAKAAGALAELPDELKPYTTTSLLVSSSLTNSLSTSESVIA